MSANKEPILDAEELAVAEERAETVGVDAYTHTFQTPFTYEGRTFQSLTFQWERLTGEDSLAIEQEMQAIGKPVIIPAFSGEYLVRMAARACTERIGQDVVRAFPLRDYNQIRDAASSFLLK